MTEQGFFPKGSVGTKFDDVQGFRFDLQGLIQGGGARYSFQQNGQGPERNLIKIVMPKMNQQTEAAML